MKKISNKFIPDGPCIYKKGRRNYMEKPRQFYIKYYIYNEVDKTYTAILKRPSILLPILLTLSLLVGLWYLVSLDVSKHTVEIATTMYLEGNALGLNIVNKETNKRPITISLKADNGISLLKPKTIKVGEALGNLPVQTTLQPGSYMCTLSYTIDGAILRTKKEYPILLIVKGVEEK